MNPKQKPFNAHIPPIINDKNNFELNIHGAKVWRDIVDSIPEVKIERERHFKIDPEKRFLYKLSPEGLILEVSSI